MNLKTQFNTSLTKILVILSFICLSVAILIISQYSIKGYELSIYDNIPSVGLFLLIFPIIAGILISLESYRKQNDLWKYGILLITLSNLIILLLPFILGYSYSANSDNLTHLGFIEDILNTCTISSFLDRNVYPILHLIVVEINLMTKIPIETIAFFIAPFFYICFLIYTYILARELTPSSKIFSLLSSTVLFCYFFKELFPMGVAFLTFPLIFYVYYHQRQKKNMSYSILLLVLLAFMPFFHMIAAIVLTIILIIFEILNLLVSHGLLNKFSKRKKTDQNIKKYQLSFTLAIFSSVIILLWMWHISWVWMTSVSNVLYLFSSDLTTQSMLNSANQSFNLLGLNLVQIIDLFIKLYGPVFLFSILTLFSVIIIIFKRNLSSIKNRFIFLLSFVVLFCLFLWVVDLFHPLTSLSSGRFIWIVIPLFPIFVGISLLKIYETNLIKSKNIKIFVIFLILGFSSLVTLFTIYPSPIIYQFNMAITTSEIDGADWIIYNGNDLLRIYSTGPIPIYRYQQAHGTLSTNPVNFNNDLVTNHFNYTRNVTELGNIYSKNIYLFTRPNFLMSVYSNNGIYKNLDRYNKDDLNRLENDSTGLKIYDNGETDTWFIIANRRI